MYFQFFDPPYLVSNVKQYYNTTEDFNYRCYVDLKIVCDELSKKSVNWMMTVNKNDDLQELFNGYNIHIIEKYSSMSRGMSREFEMIISNYFSDDS